MNQRKARLIMLNLFELWIISAVVDQRPLQKQRMRGPEKSFEHDFPPRGHPDRAKSHIHFWKHQRPARVPRVQGQTLRFFAKEFAEVRHVDW